MSTLRLFKKISQIAKPKTGLFISSVILILLASIFEMAGISLVIPVLNSLAAGKDFVSNIRIPLLGDMLAILPFRSDLTIFIALVFLMLVSIGLSNLFLLVSVFCASKFSADVENSLRIGIFSRYLGLGKAFYDKTEVGKLIAIMLNSTRELEIVLFSVRAVLVHIIMAIMSLLFLFMISWNFTLFVLPLVILVYYSLNWLIKKLKRSAEDRVSTLIDLSAYSTDILSNMNLVRSYANEDSEYERFVRKSGLVKFHSINVNKKRGAVPLLTDVIASTGFLFLVLLSVVFYMKVGGFSLGKFLVYFFVLRRFIIYLKPITELKSYNSLMVPHMDRIAWVFDDSDKPRIINGKRPFTGLKEKIEFKNMSFSYVHEKTALNDINFEVKKGEAVALVGPTGAGKTTIAHLLCRFYDCGSGTIMIDGVDIKDYELKSLRERIAIVTQDTMLFNDTIKNNITYGIRRPISQDELDNIARKARVYDFIMTLPMKYDTDIGDRGVKLSGGERQRISIARAILKEADILILDEATSALDTETETLIRQSIEDLMKDKTVLAIAHRLSTIKGSDWIVVLEDGRITEQGEPDQLIEKKGRFFHYRELQKFY